MKTLTKLVSTTIAATMVAGSAFAADIALVIGSNQDSFWNVVKKGAKDAAVTIEARGGSLNILQTNNYDNYGAKVATQPVLTGPAIVDASNIDATFAGVEAGTR